jgi:hypothetical protein
LGSGERIGVHGPRVKRLKRVSIGVFPRRVFFIYFFSRKWRNRRNSSKSIVNSRVSVIQYNYFDTFSNVIIEKYGV